MDYRVSMIFYLLFHLHTIRTELKLTLERLTLQTAQFSLQTDQDGLQFQEKLQKINYTNNDLFSITQSQMNFFLFNIENKNQQISVEFTGDCLIPLLLLSQSSHLNNDPVDFKDSSNLQLDTISFGAQILNQIQVQQQFIFDLEDTQQDYSFLKSQEILTGEGQYTAVLFCPIFIENVTLFSFKIKISSIQSEYLTPNRDDNSINQGNQQIYIYQLEPFQKLILYTQNLTGQKNFDFNITQTEMRIELEYEKNGNYQMIRYINSTIHFLHTNSLSILIQNLQNQTSYLGMKIKSYEIYIKPTSHRPKKVLIIIFSILISVALISILFILYFQKFKKQQIKEEIKIQNPEQEKIEKQKSTMIEQYFNSKISFFKDEEFETYDYSNPKSYNQFQNKVNQNIEKIRQQLIQIQCLNMIQITFCSIKKTSSQDIPRKLINLFSQMNSRKSEKNLIKELSNKILQKKVPYQQDPSFFIFNFEENMLIDTQEVILESAGECQENILQQFGFKNILSKPILNTSTKYCYSERFSCCPQDELIDKFNFFNKINDELNQTIQLMVQIMIFFKETFIQRGAIREKCKSTFQKNPYFGSNNQIHKIIPQTQQNIHLQAEMMKQDIEDLQLLIQKKYYNYLCGICNPQNHQFFQINENSYQIQMSQKSCLNYLEEFSIQFKLSAFYEQHLKPIVYYFICQENEFEKQKEFLKLNYNLNLQKLKDLQQHYENCEFNFSVHNVDCQKLCNQQNFMSFEFLSNFNEVFGNAFKILFMNFGDQPSEDYYSTVNKQSYQDVVQNKKYQFFNESLFKNKVEFLYTNTGLQTDTLSYNIYKKYNSSIKLLGTFLFLTLIN